MVKMTVTAEDNEPCSSAEATPSTSATPSSSSAATGLTSNTPSSSCGGGALSRPARKPTHPPASRTHHHWVLPDALDATAPTFHFGASFEYGHPDGGQHIVQFHVNPGVTVSFRVGDTIQLVKGPVTVPMVSTNQSPPIAMPVQVPHGHVVQQIVDENGTLRHVILSPQPYCPATAHYGPSSGSTQGGPPPQTFFAPPGLPPFAGPPPPPHFSPIPMAHVPPAPPGQPGRSPPPAASPASASGGGVGQQTGLGGAASPGPSYFKDERSQKQYNKLRRKLEQKHRAADSGSRPTPPPSPRKGELVNGLGGRRGGVHQHTPGGPGPLLAHPSPSTSRPGMPPPSSLGTSEDGEESSSQQDEEDDMSLAMESLILNPPKVVELHARSALIEWSPPTRTSDTAEYSDRDLVYEVMLSDKGKEAKYKPIYKGPNSLSCRIKDLRPGTEYFVCLQLHLNDIHGGATEPTTFTTPACPPDTPLPPKLHMKTRNSILLRWTPPPDNGASIIKYLLEYDEGRGTEPWIEVYHARGKQFNVCRLQPAVVYQFRLAAVNDKGKSGYSEVIEVSTIENQPLPPSPPVLREARPRTLLLTWSKRACDNDFTLQMQDRETGYGYLPVYTGTDTSWLCESLQRHKEYAFRLKSHNDGGDSRWSEEVCYRTLPECPSAPGKPHTKGRIHSHNFHIRWDPPSDKGGASIASYQAEVDRGKGYIQCYQGLEAECKVDGLQPGVSYSVRVSCSNSGGCHSPASEPAVVTTEAVCPGQCSAPRTHGRFKPTAIMLKWAPPNSEGGAPITEFLLEMEGADRPRSAVYRGRQPECLVAGLAPGRPYTFYLRAFNRVGASAWSEPAEFLSGAAPPGTPTAPLVQCPKSANHVSVCWEAPDPNGAAITEYRLEMSNATQPSTPIAESSNILQTQTSNGSSESDNSSVEITSPLLHSPVTPITYSLAYQGPETSCELKGLVPSASYLFRLQAGNSAGWSAFSDATSLFTPASPPGPCTNLVRIASTPYSLTIGWAEPPEHGSPISQYQIEIGDRRGVTTTDSERRIELRDLQPNTVYRIRVQAVNAVGSGPFSSPLRISTLPLPPAPPKLECIVFGHNYLKLRWGDGKYPNFTQYSLEMQSLNRIDDDFNVVYKGTCHTTKVTKLQERTTYTFRISAIDDAGVGDYSPTVQYSTCTAPPSAIKPPRVSEIETRSCLVEWQQCRPPTSPDPIIYQVQLIKIKSDQDYKQIYRGDELKARLDGLEPGTDYSVRVCPIRQASTGDLSGPFTTPTIFSTSRLTPTNPSNAASASNASSSSGRSSSFSHSQLLLREPLSDRQWALLWVVAFSLVAILLAVGMQQLIARETPP